MILPPDAALNLSYIGGISIDAQKKYYNQNDMADAIKARTGCRTADILLILNSLGDAVKEKFGGNDDYVEIKIFPGLKIVSKRVPSDKSVSQRLNIGSGCSIFMSANFTDDFRKKVKQIHKSIS